MSTCCAKRCSELAAHAAYGMQPCILDVMPGGRLHNAVNAQAATVPEATVWWLLIGGAEMKDQPQLMASHCSRNLHGICQHSGTSICVCVSAAACSLCPPHSGSLGKGPTGPPCQALPAEDPRQEDARAVTAGAMAHRPVSPTRSAPECSLLKSWRGRCVGPLNALR